MSPGLLETVGGTSQPHRSYLAPAPSLRWLARPTTTSLRSKRSPLVRPTNRKFGRDSHYSQELRHRDRIAANKRLRPALPATSGARKPCPRCPSERSHDKSSVRILNSDLSNHSCPASRVHSRQRKDLPRARRDRAALHPSSSACAK